MPESSSEEEEDDDEEEKVDADTAKIAPVEDIGSNAPSSSTNVQVVTAEKTTMEPSSTQDAAKPEPVENTEAMPSTAAPVHDVIADRPAHLPLPHELYTCEHLIELFRHMTSSLAANRHPTVGMVGYPNVS